MYSIQRQGITRDLYEMAYNEFKLLQFLQWRPNVHIYYIIKHSTYAGKLLRLVILCVCVRCAFPWGSNLSICSWWFLNFTTTSQLLYSLLYLFYIFSVSFKYSSLFLGFSSVLYESANRRVMDIWIYDAVLSLCVFLYVWLANFGAFRELVKSLGLLECYMLELW